MFSFTILIKYQYMSKIYIFGIGGTGSRVLRALTMFMAAGVKIGTDEIVPIIIDPDASNADLTRTVTLLNNYASIRKSLSFDESNSNEFFKTAIERIVPNYSLRIKDTEDKSFKQFISYGSMSKSNQALAKMLFSEKNLEASMDVGFKGNPNIGSVVLNQIVDTDDFKSFANSFNQGDGIFIISSIFGGTGASGFPLLLKSLRTGKDFPNNDLINNAQIGAVTVLPYFKLKQNDDSEIDSSTFISKTKSALAYYENNIIKNNAVDEMYYLADNLSATYENYEGGSMQKNDAHLIEFLAASSIVDFSYKDKQECTDNLELGIKEVSGAVSFDSFYDRMQDMLFSPLTQFTLMSNALTYKVNRFKSSSFNANKGNFEDIYDSRFFGEITDYFVQYKEWLKEMKNNKRSLDLFNIECEDKPFNLVTGITPKRIMSRYSDYDLVVARLDSAVRACKSKEAENKFLEMFYIGTKKLVAEKLNK